MIRKLFGVLAVILFTASPLQAQLYQWVDENGVKHFSNTPPPEGATVVREYEEVKSAPAAESGGESESESGAGPESGGEREAEAAQASPPEEPVLIEPAGESEEQSGAVAEGAGEEGESGDVDEAGTSVGAVPPDAGESSATEQESALSPAAGPAAVDELIAQERDRLEITIAQLNRQLEEAQTARDRGSSYDVEQWNERIEQIRSQIEEEKSQSEARIDQIRKTAGSQP